VCSPGSSVLQIPVALATSEPEVRVLDALDQIGLRHRFDTIVTGDDVQRGRPDPEPYLYAAQRMERPTQRCVVIGNSNLSIEAAHEVRA
jgi:HAD superfamily hydrolase (TIGR01509 family)